MDRQPVSFATFQVGLRPARAVYLVSAATETVRTGVRAAIQSASTRWAGVCEPIVLVAADGSAEDWQLRVARIAGVDAAVNVDVPDELAASVAARLGLPLVPLALIDTSGVTVFTCHPGWLGAATTVDGSNGFVLACRDGKLWEAAAAGDLTEEHQELLPYEVLAVRRPAAGNYEVAEAQLWRHTLIERTLAAFTELRTRPVPVPSPLVLWVTRGDDLADCLEFWNLRAIRSVRGAQMPMVLLPEGEVEHWVGFDRTFRGMLRRVNEFSPDVVLVSRTLDARALAAYAERLGLAPGEAPVARGYSRADEPLMRSEPYTFATVTVEEVAAWCGFEREYGESAHAGAPVIDGKASVRFPSPIPFTGDGFALMTLTSPALAKLPKRTTIAELVVHGANWRGDRLQLQVPARPDYWFELGIPSSAEAVRRLLAERTTRYELSDKGAVGAALMDGSAAAALLEPNVFEAVVALRTPRADAVARELAKVQGVDVADLDQAIKDLATQYGGRRERQFSTATNLPLPGEAGAKLAALERLAQVGWAERGMQIKCPACKLDSFLPLSESMASGPAHCPGCMSPAQYERVKASIAVAYRLDSRVDRATDQGVVPHLLAMSALLAADPDTYLLLGVDMWFAGLERKQEADLFGIHAGKIVLGEVKQNGMNEQGFNEEQVRHDVQLAVRAGADIYLMASPTGVPAEAEALAGKLCAETGLELTVLGQPQLRPTATPTP